jgi:hypothetical protein
MCLYHVGVDNLLEVKAYPTRMAREDIGTVAMEAFDRVEASNQRR